MNKKKNNLSTRRSFITKTGIAAAGMTYGAATPSKISCERTTEPNDKILTYSGTCQ